MSDRYYQRKRASFADDASRDTFYAEAPHTNSHVQFSPAAHCPGETHDAPACKPAAGGEGEAAAAAPAATHT